MPYLTGIPDTRDPCDDGSHWQVREEPNGVSVRNSRVPLGPEVMFTRDEWSDLLRVVASGRLPACAVELGDGYAFKIAPPGQERNALSFWLDEMDAFTRDVRNGVYGLIPPNSPTGQDPATD